MIKKNIGILGSVVGLTTLLSANTIKNMESLKKGTDEDEKRISLSNLRDPTLKCKKGHRYKESKVQKGTLINSHWACINCGRLL